jgi:hypothetical protein
MKSNAIWITGLLAAVLASECHAQLNGCDDFNDNSKDTNRWGPVVTQGCCGLLTETNGRLEFTKSSGTSSALVSQPWILNFGSYTQNWEVQIDASMPQLGFPESVFGLGLISGTNLASGNRLQMSLFESSSEGRFFLMRFGTNGGSFDRAGQVATTSTFAGLRIAFDASTKVLSAFYDEDGPVNGYSWTLLGSTNISTAWSMTSTDVFGIFVFGRAEADVVASTNNLFGDNFCTFSETAPSVVINLAGGNVVLSWSTNAPGYHLQSASALRFPGGWQDVTNAPAIVSTNFNVTNAVMSDKGFYRLSR